MNKKPADKRLIVISSALAAIMLVYTCRFGYMQLINADSYRELSDTSHSQKVNIKAARGEILDRYGRPIAVNRQAKNIVLDAINIKTDTLNNVLLELTALLAENGEKWNDELPLTATEPVEYAPSADAAVTAMQDDLGLNRYATAQNCYDAMVQKYGLARYSFEEQRTVMGIRYTMEKRDFSISAPFTLSEDISESTAAHINEAPLDGVNVEIVPVREYVETNIAAPIIGTVSKIYAEDDWDLLKAQGYQYDDKIGRSGIESAMESELRGTAGVKKVVQNAQGEVVSVTTEQEPVSGNTVILTLDSSLQQTAQDSLKKTVDSLQGQAESDSHAGAVVVIDVNTFEILASATYPSYSMEEYKTDYDRLSKDQYKPLYNRALQGLYAPGSTFKPAIAAAALQEDIITETSTINCTKYFHANELTFKCLGNHGSINVLTALSKSCNYFFFTLADRLGIDKMNQYCRLLGLGMSTGIELTEYTGTLAGKQSRSSWNYGDTIQAAIGQSDNLFTPLQLAVYTATIANGGTRYKAHFVKEVKSYSLQDTVRGDTPEVLNETGLRDDVIATVKKGMLSVSLDGTAKAVFKNYPIEIGAKTGTAEISNGIEHAVFIAFAPYENPEIAVAAVIENGGHGASVAPLIKDIFDAYFFSPNEKYTDQQVNTLLP